jgi:hypothetical protein
MHLFTSATDEGHGGGFSLIHSDSHHANAIVVPDAELLFTGSFHRSGLDLVLTGHDGRHHVIPSYFANEHPPALMAPNGAHLTPEIVDMLAGSSAPHEYAQAGAAQPAAPPDSIGKVQKVTGTVTVLRNGVSVAVNVGDVVYKSDVIITAADSKCGITFPDGTALELLPNTRMALNEYNYDAHSTSNQALFTLIDGTFGFVAGKVAHSGDMKIGTPVTTMGIRGTTGVVQHVHKVNATIDDSTYSFSVYDDPGTTTSGWWDMFVQNTDGSEALIATVSQTGYVTFVTPQGAGLPPLVTTVPLTASQLGDDQLIIQDLFETYALGGPRSIGIPGSGDNPLLQLPPNSFPGFDNGGGSNGHNFQLPGLPGLPPPADPQGPVFPSNSNIFIWPIGNGTWPTGPIWNQGFSPTDPIDIVIIESGIVTYDLNLTIYSLTINASLENGGLPPGEVLMIGGGLAVTNGLDIFGTLFLQGDPPFFASYGTSTIESGGKVIVTGAGAVAEFSPNPANPNAGPITVNNFGTMAAKSGGDIEFITATVTNEAANLTTGAPAGVIEAKGADAVVDFTDTTFINHGKVVAAHTGADGGVFFVNTNTTNEAGGSITAKRHGTITFATSSIIDNPLGIVAELVNSGRVAAESGGEINIDVATFNEITGRIVANGCDSLITLTGEELDNFGLVRATSGGTVKLVDADIINQAANTTVSPALPGGKIEAQDWGRVEIQGGIVSNLSGAVIKAADHGGVFFEGTHADPLEVTNSAGGKIVAMDCGLVAFEDATFVNAAGAVVEAKNYGVVSFFESKHSTAGITNLSTIEAVDHGVVAFIDVGGDHNNAVNNAGGTIEAIGCGATVELVQSSIDGGTLQTRDGGKIEAVFGWNTFSGVTINGGIVQVDCQAALALKGDTAIDKTVTFEGPGVFVLKGLDSITGGDAHALLKNDSTIEGSGTIGGNGLALINEFKGDIVADGGKHTTLTIDTGTNRITNDGTMEAVLLSTLEIDSKLENFGRVVADFGGKVVDDANVVNEAGGKIEAFHGGTVTLDGNKITNDGAGECAPAGLILADGHDSKVVIKSSTVDNDGKIEAKNGGVVDIFDTEVDNRGGHIDASGCGSLIVLAGSDVIDGTVSLDHHGALDVTRDSTLDNVDVTAGYSGEIDVKDGAILTLDDGTTVSGGTLKIEHGSELLIESSHGATLDGVDVVNHGTIQVDILADSATVPLVLTGDTIIDGGKLAVGSDGLVQVEGRGATFDGVKVDVSNGGEIGVGQAATHTHNFFESNSASGTILMLDDDTVISGGTLVIESHGEVDVEGGKTGTGAMLKHVDVQNSGLIQVEEGAVLDLEGDIIAGGTLNTIGYPPSYGQDGGVIEVLAKGGATTFDGSANKVTVEGYVQVAAGAELELKGRIDLDSADNLGIIELDQTQAPHAKGSTLEISGAVTLSGNGYIALEGSKTSIVAAQNGATLTNKSNIFGGGNIGHDGDGALTFINAGLVEATAAAAGHIVIDTGTTTTNTGTLDGADYSELDLYGTFKNAQGHDKGLIEATGVDGTVALFNVTIQGGNVSVGATDVLSVIGGGNTSILDGVAATDNGAIDVGSTVTGAILMLEGGAAITGNGTGTLTITAGNTLDIEKGTGSGQHSGATLDGLNVTDHGAIDVGDAHSGATLTLDGGTVITGDGAGKLTIENGSKLVIESSDGATLDGVDVANHGKIKVDSLADTMTVPFVLEGGTTINGGELDIGDHGVVQVAGSGATFDGVTVDIAADAGGTGEIDVGQHHSLTLFETNLAASGTILTLDDDTIISGGTLAIESNGEVDVAAGPNGTGATLEGLDVKNSGLLQVEQSAVLTLEGVTEEGGTLLTVGSPYGDGGVIEVSATGGTTIFDGTSNAVTEEGYVKVAADATLELRGEVDVNNDNNTTFGIIEIDQSDSSGGTLTISGTVTLGGTDGEVVLEGSNTSIVGAAAGAVLNSGVSIFGAGNIGHDGDGNLTFNNSGLVFADGGTSAPIVIDTGNDVTNTGTLQADGGTLQIDDNVVDNNMIVGADSGTVVLDGITVSGGEISIDSTSTLEIENGATVLSSVDVEIATGGNLLIDSGSTIAWLEVDTGSTIHGGTITIGDVGELDVEGGTFDSVTIDDKGIFHIDGPLTIKGDISIDLDGGTFTDTGALTVAANTSATISGAPVGTVNIEDSATFTLDNADAAFVDFKGSDGTFVLDASSHFTGTVEDLSAGDTIDFAGIGTVTSAVFDGSTLDVNGTSINISGLSAAAYDFYFTPDSAGGTDFVVAAAPQISINAVDGNNVINIADAEKGVTISGTASDSSVDVDGQNITIDILDGSNKVVESFTTSVSGGQWSVSLTPAEAQALADGTYTVTANLANWATDSATPTDPIVVDQTTPTVAVTTNSSDVNLAQNTSLVTFTFSEAPTDFSLADTSAVGGALSNLTKVSAAEYTATFTASANYDSDVSGLGSVSVTAGSWQEDNGNLGAGGSTSFAVDTVTPAVAVLTNSTDVNLTQGTATITFAFTEAPTDFSLADTSAVGGTLTSLTKVSATEYTATFTAAANYDSDVSGPGSVSVTAGSWHEDNGNPGAGGSTSFTVDTVAPTVAVTTNSNDVNLAHGTSTVTFTFSEAPTDFSLSDVTAKGGTLGNLTLVSGSNGTEYTATFTAASNYDSDVSGLGSVSVTAGTWHEDNGNSGGGATSTGFAVDTVTPTVAVTTSNINLSQANDTATITFTFSEAPTDFSLADTSAVGGTLSNLTKVNATEYTATFTGAADTDISNAQVSVTAGSWHEDNGNSGAGGSTGSFTVDTAVHFNFVPTAATLSALEDGGLVLQSGEQIGTFFATTGNPGDNYTFTITGPDHDFTSASAGSNSEALFANQNLGNDFDLSGGSTVYSLTVDIKDTTLGQDSGPQPFDVVVDDSFFAFGDSDTIKLTGANSLGINAATPTIVYGLSGNDTIDATGMTANVWFVGGSGSDTMTGGSGVNTYVFASVSESETPSEGFFGGPTDTITNFNTAKDLIDLAPMNTVTTIQGLLTHTSTNVNADSVAWIVSGSSVIVYANTDPSSAHSQNSDSGFESEIILSASSNAAATALASSLSAINFILAPPPPGAPDMTAATDTGVSNTDSITSDTTPTFTGTGTVGDTVTLFDGSTAIGSGVVGAGGTYTITTSALANGAHSIAAEQTDALGDTGALSAPLSVTIDTVAPTVSSITTSGSGISNGSGDLGAGHTVTFSVNFSENVYVSGTPNFLLNDGGTATYQSGSGSGTLVFTYTVTAGQNVSDLALGSGGINLNGGTIQDIAGNNAVLTGSQNANPSGTLQIDTAAPTLTVSGISPDTGSSNTDGITDIAKVTVSGTIDVADHGLTITVKDGSAIVGTTTADSNGNWSLTNVTLSSGTNNLTATATDGAGNAGTSTAFVATLDTTAPTAVGTVTALSSDTGSSSSDFVTNVASQTVSGTYSGTLNTGDTIQVSANGGTTWVTATVNTSNHTWSVTGVTLSSGTGTLSVQTVDTAGNTAAGTGHSYTLDTTAPTLTVGGISPDSGSSNTDGVTNVATVTVSGTIDAADHGLTITVKDGSTIVGATTADSNGNWNLTNVTLTNGTNNLTATATDGAGNAGTSTAFVATLDTTAPTAVGTVTALSSDTGSSSSDFVTNVASQTVSGTYSGTLNTGDTIQVSANGGTTWVTATVNTSNHTWSASGVTLSSGTGTLSVQTVDTAGNTAAGTGHSYTLDTTAPTLTVGGISPDTGSSSTDGITKIATVTVSGTIDVADHGLTITVKDGSTIVGTTTADSNGNWSLTTVTLANGTNNLTATATDTAGNVGTSTAFVATLDTAAPAALGTVTALSQDTGASSTDFITDVASQTVSGTYSGTLNTGDTIQVSANGGSTWVTATVNTSNHTWSASGVTLSSGTGTLSVQTVDIAGNTAAGTGHAYTLDTTAPTALGTVTAISPDTGASSTDFITDVASQTVSGTYTGTLGTGDTIQVSANSGTTWVTATVNTTNHTWSASGVTLSSGAGTLSVQTIDTAGNTAAGTGHSYTLDTTAPTALGTVTALSQDTGASSTDFITDVASQTVSGTYTGTLGTGETIQVSADSGTTWVTATVNTTNHTWSAGGVTLSNGTGTLSVQTVDIAGNTAAGTGHSYTLDTTAPTALGTVTALSQDTGASSTDFITDVASQTVSGTYTGTLGTGDTIQVSANGGTTWITATVNTSNHTWSASGVTLSNGTGSLSVQTVDTAGNTAAGTGHSYTLDTTAPTALGTVTAISPDTGTSSTDFLTNVASQTVSGTYTNTLGTGETIQVSANGGTTWVTATVNTTNHTWSASGVTLSSGTGTLSVQTIDTAGNTTAGTGHSYTLDTTAPVISVPSGTQSLTLGTQTSISGVSVTEANNVTGETFTVTLSDNNGTLSATDGTWNATNHTLTLSGLSLTTLNSDLATLKDTDSTSGSDTITVNATDSFGNAATQQTIAVNASSSTPTGFTFTPDAATLGNLENAGFLTKNVQIGTFTESGGNAGDTYTFTIGGAGSNFKASAGTNSEALFTNSNVGDAGNNPGLYALTVTVNDTTNHTSTSALPFDVVVGTTNVGATINLHTGSGNLGIAATTPTIVYGMIDGTISASGMTANVWFVGGTGQQVMTGGTGQNVYLYADVSESDNGLEFGSGPDTITNFTHGRDVIDFAPMSGVTTVLGLQSSISQVAAHSIEWVVNGTTTTVYVNTDSQSHSINNSGTDSVMEIVLDNITNLAATDFILSNGTVGPAGTAGSPINLALSNPSSTNGAPVSVTISGMPSGWSLNAGENLGNGTWAVQSEDLSQLELATAATFAGAMLLKVAETWTNADGTTGTAFIADNVEAYALGSPIFALAGDDNLTGTGGNDMFVFAQPIGNDTIYGFNAASDTIDLTGFSSAGSYGDLHIADNAGGNAVITLGNGETITLAGVDASALSASDFVFNQTPVTVNHGTITVGDGAELPLSGTIDNVGLIAIDSTGDQSVLQLTGDGATLDGGGHVTMSGDAEITGTGPSDVLTNVDNTISGSGQIGTGDGNLTLVNEAHGVINADVAGAALVLDTGHAIVNAGLLEATNGGVLQVDDAVNGGNANIAGGIVAFEAQANVNVTFDNGSSGTDYGKLDLGHAESFTGTISGFSGTDAAHSDVVDLADINFNSAQFAETYHANTGVLTVTDGANSASLTFDGLLGALNFASDGNGGTAITDAAAPSSAAATAGGTLSFADNDAASDLSASVTAEGQNYVGHLTTDTVTESNGAASIDYGFSLGNDQINVAPGQTVTQSYQVSLVDAQNPAANATQTVAVSIGGAGNDNFVFAPGVGHDTVLNFNAQQDTVELDHFANAQTVQELQSLITADAHGNAVIDLGNHDSITFANTTQAQLQQAVQNGHVLLH